MKIHRQVDRRQQVVVAQHHVVQRHRVPAAVGSQGVRERVDLDPPSRRVLRRGAQRRRRPDGRRRAEGDEGSGRHASPLPGRQPPPPPRSLGHVPQQVWQTAPPRLGRVDPLLSIRRRRSAHVLADPPAGPGDLGSPSRPRNTAWAVLPLRQQPIPSPSPSPSTAKDWRGARSKQRSADRGWSRYGRTGMSTNPRGSP